MPRLVALGVLTVLLHGTAMAQTPSLRLGTAVAKGPVLRHNPIFGLGPQTIWKGGIGVGLEVEGTRAAGALETRDRALHAAPGNERLEMSGRHWWALVGIR